MRNDVNAFKSARSQRDQTGKFRLAAFELLQREQAAKRSVTHEHADNAAAEKYGCIPREKPEDSWWLMFENWNSLRIFSVTAKTDEIDHLVWPYEVDTVAGYKTQYDWRQVKLDNCRFHNVLGNGQSKKSTVGYNTTDEEGVQNQMGGTTMMTIDRLLNDIVESGCNHTGLGR